MNRTHQTSATCKRARLAAITTLAILMLAGCNGGGGSGAEATFNSPPPGGGGTPGNAVPVITSTPPTSATVGSQYTYQATATDADGDPLAWSLTTSPTGMSVNATGLVTWTPAQDGTFNVTLQVTDGIDNAQQSWSITVTTNGGLPANVSLTDMGALPNNMLVLSDMVEFDGKLFIAAAQDPLNTPFGAGVYRFDDSNNQITAAHYDSGSQGFLRLKVYGGSLYAPDGDPNGLTPGHVYVWSSGTGSPLQTTVPNAVHNFDVIDYNGNLYVSGSNDSNQSTLHMFDGSATWNQVSADGYTRLKYMGVLDNEIWSSKTAASNSADFVTVDSTMDQTGYAFSQGGGNLIPAIEMIDGKLYMAVWGQTTGVSNIIVESGSNVVAINGISGLMWDVIKHTDNNYYAVAWDGTNDLIYGSTDGVNFTQLFGQAGTRFGQPGNNQDGRPSIASYNGKLYVGSSTNGRLYRLD